MQTCPGRVGGAEARFGEEVHQHHGLFRVGSSNECCDRPARLPVAYHLPVGPETTCPQAHWVDLTVWRRHHVSQWLVEHFVPQVDLLGQRLYFWSATSLESRHFFPFVGPVMSVSYRHALLS